MSVRGVVFLAVMAGLFMTIGSLFGLVGAASALALAIVLAFWSYWSAGPELILATGAELVEDPAILILARDLAARAGIPTPQLYEIEDAHPNAFTVGANPKSASIIITSALREELPTNELSAVLAHEIAHIRNKDIFAATLAVTCVETVLLLAVPLALLGLVLRRNGGWGMIATAILAPTAAIILRCAMTRSIEYRADRDAAYLCGDAMRVIAALQRLAHVSYRRHQELALQNPLISPMFFVGPLPDSWASAAFGCHPTVAQRVARLVVHERTTS